MFNVCNTANTAVTCDEISGISGSGNPSIDHVSLAVSTRSRDTPVQLDTHILSGDRQCRSI